VARRFVRRALLLDQPAASVGAALDHLGYVQIDPIDVCGRMHDLILRNRVAGYREGGLLRHVHGGEPAAPRGGFEHYLPGQGVLAAFPWEAWPWLAGAIRGRRTRGGLYGRTLGPAHEVLARRILAEIAARGPLTSDDIEHDGRAMTAWGTPGRLVKNLLEILFVHGRVLLAARRGFRRVYDLPERVVPAAVFAAPVPADAELRRWIVRLRLRQRRLVRLNRAELAAVADEVQTVVVEGCPPLHCRRADLPLFEECRVPAPADAPALPPLLLAPLDPLIYDRRVTRDLWDFDYTWEVYTPPDRRRRGYYALPVMAGTELVGHIEPRIDRAAGRLRVVSRAVRRGCSTGGATRELARFLGVR
jgi:uncharacterized protein YcaQ